MMRIFKQMGIASVKHVHQFALDLYVCLHSRCCT